MPPIFCSMCNRIVQAGDRHSCFLYKDNEIADNVRQPYETEKEDINRGERIGQHAGSLQQNNGNSYETAQQIEKPSQASTSNVEIKKLDGETFRDSKVSEYRGFAQEPCFQAPGNMEIFDAGADHPLDLRQVAAAVPGPSTNRHQNIGPDGKILYVCDVCSYQCKKKSQFDKHYTTHTGEKNHVCEICGKGFAEKGNLKKHKRTHTGIWPYRCEKCGKGFSQRVHLEIHLRRHTGERPFECQKCEARFASLSNLRRHVANSCRGPYWCGQCQQAFSSNEDRNRHFMQEHGQRE